jgi:hypothetical protein
MRKPARISREITAEACTTIAGTKEIFKFFNKDAFVYWDLQQPADALRLIEELESNKEALDAMFARYTVHGHACR